MSAAPGAGRSLTSAPIHYPTPAPALNPGLAWFPRPLPGVILPNAAATMQGALPSQAAALQAAALQAATNPHPPGAASLTLPVPPAATEARVQAVLARLDPQSRAATIQLAIQLPAIMRTVGQIQRQHGPLSQDELYRRLEEIHGPVPRFALPVGISAGMVSWGHNDFSLSALSPSSTYCVGKEGLLLSFQEGLSVANVLIPP
jgi:hypothetical protein